MKKAFIQTFGCQMNEHDSHKMRRLLDQLGYETSAEMETADLVILNTCSVRENPENKVYSMVGRLAKVKATRPEMVIAVGGCVAQQEGKTILRRQKAVDFVFGPDQIFQLEKMLDEVGKGKRGVYIQWQPRDKKIQNFIPEEELTTGEVIAGQGMIAITKGCDNHCSFCIVPQTRGTLVSRELENIVEEAQDLIAKGAVELLLLGQNVNSYRAKDKGFLELMQAVAGLDGLKRLRFTSPYPNDWNSPLTDLMASHPVICNQLHLPFQAGSDRILKLMRRDHTQAEYLEKIAELREKIPGIELSSDVIVGYPGETDAEFLETLDVIKKVRFFQLYSFKYSPRPGTKAEKETDGVPREVKEARLDLVLKAQKQIRLEILDTYIGGDYKILIDSAHPTERGVMQGRTDSGVRVSVAAPNLELGDWTTAHITERREHSLVGVVG